MKHRILALDLGSTMGWASYGMGGIETFKEKDTRLIKFHRFIEKLIKDIHPTIIVFENSFHQRGGAAVLFGSWRGILEMLGQKYKIPVEGYATQSIKKDFTGSAKRSPDGDQKQPIIDECIRRGHTPINHDHADALAMYLLMEEKLNAN